MFWIATIDAFAESRNDENGTPFCDSIKYHATNRKTILAMTKADNSTESSDKINLLMDCHENPHRFSRNDERRAIPRKNARICKDGNMADSTQDSAESRTDMPHQKQNSQSRLFFH